MQAKIAAMSQSYLGSRYLGTLVGMSELLNKESVMLNSDVL